MIRLRNFRKDDLARLHELDQICFPVGISYSIAELRYFLINPRCRCWIAEETDEELVGFLIVEKVRRSSGMSGHIVTLDVSPHARRHGVGKLLMEAAEERMKREGASLLTLEMAVNNEAARAFYGRLGFSRIGKIPEYYPGKLDAEVMEKSI
jgi:[ribosomal protein S18]-alanine N-acetyltransferase